MRDGENRPNIERSGLTDTLCPSCGDPVPRAEEYCGPCYEGSRGERDVGIHIGYGPAGDGDA